MKKLNLKYGLVALAGLGLSANVSATDLTCADIEFSPAAFAAYEFIDKACLEMVDRNGGTFAKLTATKVVPSGIQQGVSNFLQYTHADGSLGPRHKTVLPRSFEAMIGGQPVRLADIQEGQQVNVYVGSENWAPLAMVEEMVEEAVVEEVVEEMVEEAVEEEMVAEVLPTTAGPLPWLALFGSLLLVLGGALRFSRK
jgi:hypothetical protein